MTQNTNKDSELQGISRLATEATLGITDLVQAVQKRIVEPYPTLSTPVQYLITRIAGVAFKNIRWATRFIGGRLDQVLGRLAPVLGNIRESPEKAALRAVLNGIIGDYLEEQDNPLRIKMQLKYQLETIPLDGAGHPFKGKILLMLHGLCMNDQQWTRKGQNHGEELAEAMGYTPIYLHYNSGRHISTNGQHLNALLEEFVQEARAPIDDIILLTHSMGGLLARSALHYGEQQQQSWVKRVKKMVFLGVPHHGAPLERAGNYIDTVLESTPYVKPFARLGKIRSAGITDLRYGNLVETDWQGYDRFARRGDQRKTIPLPKDIDCYGIAACTVKGNRFGASPQLGDGLVKVPSALGQHKDSNKCLHFGEKATWVAYEHGHLDLLSSAAVYAKLQDWLL